MAKKAPRKRAYSLESALANVRAQYKCTPLFRPSTRRYIPMRHDGLGVLLSGPDHPGIPTGTYIEVLGEAHSGKTSLTFAFMEAVINQPDALHLIINEDGLKRRSVPRRVLFIDFEHSLDTTYLLNAVPNAVLLHVTPKGEIVNQDDANIWIHQPATLEEGTDIMIAMIESGEFGLVILDSIAAMLSDAERNKAMAENTVGETARAMGKFFRKTSHLIHELGVTVLLVNQYRDKIGIAFGDPRTKPGGRASSYYTSVSLETSGTHRTPWFDNSAAKTVKIKCKKNKITGAKDEVIYHLGDSLGLSAEVELTEMALQCGVIRNASRGRTVTFLPDTDKSREYDNMAKWLNSLHKNTKLFNATKKLCYRRGVVAGSSVNTKRSSNWEA